ncbi:MAG: hypothetical protein M1836_004437 [Candelina mexicana]|nr:MAG: hypothetical protein M1836_004437 [Candelina mexicana]
MSDTSSAVKLEEGQSIDEDWNMLGLRRGKNIAIAAACVEGLERFVFSGLVCARKKSKGKYTQQEDGSFVLMAPGDGDKPIDIVVTRQDTGYFPMELHQALNEDPGVPESGYHELNLKEAGELEGAGPTGREAAESYTFAPEYGWDGGDPIVLNSKM